MKRDRGTRTNRWLLPVILAATTTMVACAQEQPQSDYDPVIKAGFVRTGDYASEIYKQYQTAAKDNVTFDLSELGGGPLSDVAGAPVNDLLGVPTYWIRKDAVGTDITSVTVEPRTAEDEWAQAIWLTEFDKVQRPVSSGRYRLFQVTTHTADGASETHKSLEACWMGQDYCVVMDPVVLQLDAFVEGRSELLAKGWGMQTKQAGEGLDNILHETISGVAAGTVCSLNSHTTWGGLTRTWGYWETRYKNVFGGTLVWKGMGAQQTGVNCYISGSSCLSSGSGYSDNSSCSGFLGWNCDCATTGVNTGATGSSRRTWSESRCAHKFVGSVDVSFSKSGTGASFSINWNMGGIDANGGSILEACSWHSI